MALIPNALGSELKSAAAVAAIVSTRIYQDVAPPTATLPYIVYSLIGEEHEHHIAGCSGAGASEFQISCWDDAPPHTLADAVRQALDKQTGTIGTSTNTATVYEMIVTGGYGEYQPPGHGGQTGTYARTLMLRVLHPETVP